ncbi:T9SS-dependent choice-of-anchor J family protein [Pseudobacter ginsenosidimutans]|uniref:T9SS-dependent choice-of-anchor J family protein n=1 Tax=Pseudobacter ginsenosidimutans TaxID=661488 RepID=UPI0013159743|nr:choice-of-anchor J domain-containing protein [Pseudobacter ginsenosidimutans]
MTNLNVNAQSYTENFDNISLLTGNGWYIQNNSNPLGGNTWFQGTPTTATPDPGPFNAYNGVNNAYIGVNFNSTTGGTGTISNWLITPNRTLRNGDVFTFWTRRPTTPVGGTEYPDRLEVRLSTNGASTNVGTSHVSFGDFSTLLLSVNPTLVTNVYPSIWTQYTITISGLPAPTSGRIAFRYFVTGAGPMGSNSDYIGIDNVVYTPYVCPAFTLSPAAGAFTGGTAGSSYYQTLSQTGALGAPNFAITSGALPPGLTLSANGTISGTPTATGTFNFTVTASDASGCSGSQPYSITVVCPANPISFQPQEVCGNIIVDLAGMASPAGGTFSGTGVINGQFDPSVGTQTVTYDITDPYGCAHSSNTVFTVNDPGVTSVSHESQAICSGNDIIPIIGSSTIPYAGISWTRDKVAEVTGIDASGSGNISGPLVNTTAAPVTVTFTVTGQVGGCFTTATATVTVNPAPGVTLPSNISLNNAVNTCSAVATYTATGTGTPAPTLSYSFTGATTGSGHGTGSGSTFNVGVTTVTLTATNSCGSTNSSFTVTVNDTQNPTISCPAAVSVSCTGEIPVPDISSVIAADNCPGVAVTFVNDVISNQTCANKYTITRTYRATDNAGNTATCTQLITVNDQTAPVISCPANITVGTSGSCTANASFTVNATDNCGGTVTVTTLPVSGSAFPIGVTTVTATATDACGNQSTCTFTVTVTDSQKPEINAQPANRAVCLDQNAIFTINATGAQLVQWQKEQGQTWENINGENGSTFTVANVTQSENGNRYRVMLVGPCSTVYSDVVSLTINEPIEPIITTATNVCVEERNIQLLATPAGGIFSGTGVTGNNWNLEIPALGKHTISYTTTDANGCTASTSKVIELGFCNENRSVTVVQGYPNPTKGKITLKALITEEGQYNVRANDFNGRTIWNKKVHLRIGWNVFDVDLTTQKAGLYIITLGNGKEKVKILKVD